MPPWLCPACQAHVRYDDYDRVLRRRPYHCHGCGLAIAIDKTTDELIAAPKTATVTDKPPRKRR
jgi:hypothetical protein